MTSQEYIITGLNFLVEKFPTFTFKYKFEKAEITHIISVEPLEEYEKNKLYMEAESDFVFDFENIYLPEAIMFVSLNSLITINVPDMVFKANRLGLFLQEIIPQSRYNGNQNWGVTEVEKNDYNYNLAA
jgi:hypothetical protein